MSAGSRWAGRILGGLVVVLLVMDGAIKLVPLQPVTDTMTQLGFVATPMLARTLGVILLACTALYAWPRTALVGAILLTGYLGGAIATHVRAGSPLFSHVLFGAYVGLALWAALVLRDGRVRAVLLGRG